jgi:cytochrome c biogenesis protein CcdA
MFRLIELVVFVTTILSFLIASKNRDSREYTHAAIGVLLVMIGRNFLLGTDNWIGIVPGILLLSFGTWLLCSKVHKIHLWL